MTETVDRCEVCGSAERWLAVEKDRYGADYRLWCCEGCGLMYASPRLDEEGARAFYATEYRKIYGEETGAHPLRCVLAGTISAFLDHFGLAPTRVLELGCGKGDWLVELRGRFGCEIFGVDADPAMEAHARARGVSGDLPPPGTVDLVILNHVLEHLRDPLYELSAVRAHLSPNGAVFVAVPGLYTWARPALWQAAHNYQFTAGSLAELMDQAGFVPLYCDEMVTSLWSIGAGETESETIKRFLGGNDAS